jgi:two-component system sensor histidine kinase UhpB
MKVKKSHSEITKGRRTKEIIEKEKNFIDLVINSLPGIFYLFDQNGSFIRWNPNLEKVSGYSSEEISQMTPLDFFDGEDKKLVEYAIKEVFIKGEFGVEANLVTKDKRKISYFFKGIRFTSENQNYLVGMGIDVTEYKQTDEALRKSEEKLNAMLQSIGDHMSMIDKDFNIIWANEIAKKNFGNDIIGKKCYEAYHRRKEPCEPYPCLTIKAFQDGKVHEHEIQVIDKDGKIIYFHCTTTVALRDKEGNPSAVIEISRDITEHKRAQAALQESEANFRALVEQSLIGTAIIQDGKFVYVNPRTAEIVGYQQEEIIGLSPIDLTVEEDREFMRESFRKRISGEVASDHYTVRARRKDGIVIELEIYGSTIIYQKRPAFMSTIQDITERKKIEEQLKNSREQLRDLTANMQAAIEEEKRLISREIHDELGQILTGLKMDISWLDKRLPEDQKILSDKTESMIKLIDNLIETVRRISLELRPRELDDYGLVAAIEWQVQDFENRSGIKCEFISSIEDADLDRALSLVVFRILQETLTNVARHANATSVNITLEEEDGNLKLIVEDNGKGITEEDISGRKSLGILGIRERAHTFGGDVRISGKPGRGTTVILELPLKGKRK